MNKEIVKLDIGQYDLQENKAKELESLYLPMIKMLSEMEDQYNNIVSKEITKELIPEAKRLKIDIAQVRIKADKARTKAKAEILRAGNAIQGAYNTLKYAVISKEEKLLEIIQHFENLEREKNEKLEDERNIILSKYQSDIITPGLGVMPESVWNNFLAGTKLNYENKKAAEGKAEKERIEKEKAEKLYYERLKLIAPYKDFNQIFELNINTLIKDFDKLLKNLIEQKKTYDIDQENIRKENERLKKEAEKAKGKRLIEEKQRQIKEEKERKIREEKEKKERDIFEVKLKKEREEKAKIETELRLKKENEEKERQKLINEEIEIKKVEKAARLAPDKEKLLKFSKKIETLVFPELKSTEAVEILINVQKLLMKVSVYIEEKSENL